MLILDNDFYCDLCDARCGHVDNLNVHLKGAKHAKRVALPLMQPTPAQPTPAQPTPKHQNVSVPSVRPTTLVRVSSSSSIIIPSALTPTTTSVIIPSASSSLTIQTSIPAGAGRPSCAPSSSTTDRFHRLSPKGVLFPVPGFLLSLLTLMVV